MSEAKKYLDQAGVDAFWSKVKAKVGEKKEIADVNGLQSALDAKADQETTYTKEEVDAAIKAKVEALGAVLTFKGVKATKAELPAKASNPVKGDVWHVTENSAEYVWDGTNWEELGTTVSLDGYLTKTEADNTYAKSADIKLDGVQANGTDLTITNKKVNIATGATNGTIAVNGTDVAVKGLGSAAYTASTAYATAAQGGKADTALQPADIEAITTDYINGLK